jgi:hypothetical protein
VAAIAAAIGWLCALRQNTDHVVKEIAGIGHSLAGSR